MTETIFAPSGLGELAVRSVAGVLLALAVASAAWRAGWLGKSGFIAATACGAACVAAGWRWAAVLILYFTAASALSAFGARKKTARSESIVSKGGARDAAQVLANGGLYSLAAVLASMSGSAWIAWGAIGALSAASSDTWATEIGLGAGGRPRSIVSGTNVRYGESGGVTTAGLVASLGGAAFVGTVAALLGMSRGLALASIAAGVGGSLADSVLGATIQERRWCDACAEPTERSVHLCGCATRRVGGIAGLNNDVVNALASSVGFVLGILFYLVAGVAGWVAID